MNNNQVKPNEEKISWWEICTTLFHELEVRNRIRELQKKEEERLAREEARIDKLLYSIDNISRWYPRSW